MLEFCKQFPDLFKDIGGLPERCKMGVFANTEAVVNIPQ